MTRIFRALAVLAVVSAAMTAAISGVLAFESQIVKVDARVANALATTVDFQGTVLGAADAAFPEEFIQDSVTVGLSAGFLTNGRFDTVAFDVVLQCADLRPGFAGGVHWMGDFTYVSDVDPGAIKPGGLPGNGITFGGDTPEPAGGPPANLPWNLIGGAPLVTPAFGCDPQTFALPSSQSLVIGGLESRSIFFGVDVPVCEATYNPSTEDTTANQSGYLTPTLIIKGADPRNVADCAFNAGMDLVFQVTGFTAFNNPPSATILSTTPAVSSIAFLGSGSDVEDGPIPPAGMFWQIALTSDPGNILQSIPGVASGTFSSLVPGTSYTITLTVTDSGSKTGFVSTAVSTTGFNNPPAATIISTTPTIDSIAFLGSGLDAEDGPIPPAEMFWQIALTSDLITFDTLAGASGGTFSGLTPGISYTITLTVADSVFKTGSTSAVVSTSTLNTPPVATILTTPAQSISIGFTGSGADTEDGNPMDASALVWEIAPTSPPTPPIQTIPGVTGGLFTNLTPSTSYTITLTVTDSGGLTDVKSVVVSTTANTPPAASIDTTTPGSITIAFAGHGADVEDGDPMLASAMSWTIAETATPLVILDTKPGLSGTFTGLTEETSYTITLTVTDSGTLTDAKSVVVSTTPNNPPTAIIAHPPPIGLTAQPFLGLGTDVEDGQLSASSLFWKITLTATPETIVQSFTGVDQGVFGPLDPSTSYTITLTATDSKGLTGSDTIVITMPNDPPTATIDSTTYDRVLSATSIAFTGHAADFEDGDPMPVSDLVWRIALESNPGIPLQAKFGVNSGTFSGLIVDTAYVITLTATDSDGVSDIATLFVSTNNPPVANITSTENFSFGVWAHGVGTDPEDGNLNSLVWTIAEFSDPDTPLGPSGSGNDPVLGLNILTPGVVYLVTLTVTDSGGLTDTDTQIVLFTP